MLGGAGARKEIENATTKALQKLRAWADLVHEAVQTEFPEFELLAAFIQRVLARREHGRHRQVSATHSVSRASGLRVVIQLPTEACHRLWCAREHIESSVPGPPANRTNSEKPESSHDGSLSLGQRSSSHERPPNGKTPQSNIGQQSALLLRLGAQRLFSRARLHKLPRTNIQPAKVAPRRAVERKP